MDNFNGGGAAPDLPPYIINPVQNVVFNNYPQTLQVNLDGVATDPDDPDENIVYSVVSNPNPEVLTATMNGRILKLIRETEDGDEFDLVMRATSDGQYVDFNIHVIIKKMEGVDESQYGIMAYPNPTDGQLTLSVSGNPCFDYHIYNHLGQCVMNGRVQGNEVRLDLGSMDKGIYVISVTWRDNQLIQKVIVQ